MLEAICRVGRPPIHANKTLAWKKCTISKLLQVDSRSTNELRHLLADLMLELLPFSSHVGLLQFDKIYFAIKKDRLSASLVDIDCRCKQTAVSQTYNTLSHKTVKQVLDFRRTMEQYV